MIAMYWIAWKFTDLPWTDSNRNG